MEPPRGNQEALEELRSAGPVEEATPSKEAAPWELGPASSGAEQSPAVGQTGAKEQAAGAEQSQVAAEGQLDRNPYAVWTTGGSSVGAGNVTSQLLPADGQFSARDFRGHHSDRSGSWAANQIRDPQNQDLQAYDFTFEQTTDSGQAIDGSALGTQLHAPADMKVLDLQKNFQGSGGYGKFIHLEDVETGSRIVLNHLDQVGEFKVGQIVSGGTILGAQGGSGNTRSQYAVHLDIIGTASAVEDFVKAQQSGTFRTGRGAGGQ